MLDAYVLHTIPYRDTSLIVKFFTKDNGVITLIAKGAKRSKSQFFGILQPFVPLLLYWKNYDTTLATLYKAEVHGAPYRLQRTYLFGALYINELFSKLLAYNDPVPELFTDYHEFLMNFDKASQSLRNLMFNKNIIDGTSISSVGNVLDQQSKVHGHDHNLHKHKIDQFLLEKNLRFMEKKLLKSIGYELELTNNIKPNKEIYIFDIENGLQIYNKPTHDNKDYNYGMKVNNTSNYHTNYNTNYNNINTITGDSYMALFYNNFTTIQQLQEAKLFMRKIFAQFLNNQPLQVRKLFS